MMLSSVHEGYPLSFFSFLNAVWWSPINQFGVSRTSGRWNKTVQTLNRFRTRWGRSFKVGGVKLNYFARSALMEAVRNTGNECCNVAEIKAVSLSARWQVFMCRSCHTRKSREFDWFSTNFSRWKTITESTRQIRLLSTKLERKIRSRSTIYQSQNLPACGGPTGCPTHVYGRLRRWIRNR